ncbi:hypothetical protein ACLOJK_034152 [Asimina triloba]
MMLHPVWCALVLKVDLIGNLGFLSEPDSLLNGPSSVLISSPLHLPRFKPVCVAQNFRSLAKQYFSDCQSLNLIFDGASAGATSVQVDVTVPLFSEPFDRGHADVKSSLPSSINNDENKPLVMVNKGVAIFDGHDEETHLRKWQNSENVMLPQQFSEGIPPKNMQRKREIMPGIAISNPRTDKISDNDLSLDIGDLAIPWSDLVLKERIGAGFTTCTVVMDEQHCPKSPLSASFFTSVMLL